MTAKKHILVIDDEASVLELIKDYLILKDYSVTTLLSCDNAYDALIPEPDLMLLDINMPGTDGLAFCRHIREEVQCPILFLTANAKESDKVKGLHAGGDDYITKPFSLIELDARIKAHLRREARHRPMPLYTFGDGFTLSIDQRSVEYDGQPLDFTKTEFDILHYLVAHPHMVLTRDQIYDQVWGIDKFGDSHIIVEHIRRIRGKLSPYTSQEFIETVWGSGYRFLG